MNEILLVNPRRRRRKTTTRRRRKTTTRKRRRNPVRRRRTTTVRRRRRRNPARKVTARSVQRNLTVAAQGALGAIGLDIALAYIPLPAQLQGPLIGPVIKGLGAIGLGAVAGMAGVKAETATRMAEGALTVQLHGLGKTLIATWAPDVNMSAYLGYYGSGYNPVDDPDWQGGMGTYIPDISADDLSMDEGGFGMYEEDQAAFAW